MRYGTLVWSARALTGLLSLSLATVGVASGQDGTNAREEFSLDSLLNVPVSSASKYEQTSREAPSSITVITAEEIRLFGYRTIEDVLRSVRGFYVSNDRNYARVGARGFGRPGDYNSRLLLLVDGVVMNDAAFGSAYVGTEFPMSLSSVERIEIVRGPASAVYGTGAMFGTVNLVLQSGRTLEGLRLRTEAGNNGLLRGSVTWGANWGSDWSFMVSGQAHQSRGEDLYFQEFDARETNGGIVRGLDRDRSRSVVGKLEYKGMTAVAGISSRTKTVPTAAWGVVFNDPRSQTTDEVRFLGLSGKTALSSTTVLSGRISTADVDYAGEYPYDVINYDASCGLWWGGELLLHSDFPFGLRLTAGAEVRRLPHTRYHSWTDELILTDKVVPSTMSSGFIEGEYQVGEPLSVVAGLRFDGYSNFTGSWSPRIALVITPWGTTTLKAIYGEAYRIPNFSEVYYEDPLGGHKRNPAVVAERIQTAEAVCEQRIGGVCSASLTVHRYAMRNLIDIALDPSDSLTYYRNAGEVRATGVEVEVVALAKSGARARVSYCYEHALDVATQSSLTNAPAHIFRGAVGGPLTPWLTVSSSVLYESQRRTLANVWTPGFWTADLTVAITPVIVPVRVEVAVRNLFDRQYSLPGATEHRQDAIPQYGRQWFAGVSIDF